MAALQDEIPESFWSLFRSYNRDTYMEALLKINEEYQYNSYFLSREVCIQILQGYFAESCILKEEQETEADLLEPAATRILNWLVRTGWLKKLEDYSEGVTNIVIPGYAAVFIDAFERLQGEDAEETEVYIQNIYAILFSYMKDPRKNDRLLKTALINTQKLNKVLQDMLHNMDKFFSSLLEKKTYGELLKEHLDGYVEEVVKKKYHILKTSDNFYLYKNDIRTWLREIREQQEEICEKELSPEELARQTGILELAGRIENGFFHIEHRIANMDREHTRYVRATVTRLNYLLNEDEDMRGLMVQLLNGISGSPRQEERLRQAAEKMNFSHVDVLTERSLYKRRKGRISFREALEPDEEETRELSREEVLRLNRVNNRYSRQQIEEFIESHMREGTAVVDAGFIHDDAELEKLILAYDYAARKGSRYLVAEEGELVTDGRYRYPRLVFKRRPRK